MKIGIDIDDTICLTNEKLIEEALVYDRKFVNGKGFKDKSAYKFIDIFYWDRQNVIDFFNYIKTIKFYENLQIRDEALYYINRLYEEGHKICFITRRADYNKTKTETLNWLKENGFKYHKIYMDCANKGLLCKRENIKILIDNALENIYSAIENDIDAILIDTRYNKNDNFSNRCENWKQIYKYINEVI